MSAMALVIIAYLFVQSAIGWYKLHGVIGFIASMIVDAAAIASIVVMFKVAA